MCTLFAFIQGTIVAPSCSDDLGLLRFEAFHSPNPTLYSLHSPFNIGHKISISNYSFFVPSAHDSFTPRSELCDLGFLRKLNSFQTLHPGQEGDEFCRQGRIGNRCVGGHRRQGGNCAGECGREGEDRCADGCRIEFGGWCGVGRGGGCEEGRMTTVCTRMVELVCITEHRRQGQVVKKEHTELQDVGVDTETRDEGRESPLQIGEGTEC